MIYAVLIIVALLAALFFLPVGVELDYSPGGRKWFVLCSGLRIPVPKAAKRWGRNFRRQLGTRLKRTSDEEERIDANGGLARMGSLVDGLSSSLETFRASMQTIREIGRRVRIRIRRLDVIVASPDPALTGFGYGMMCARAGALGDWWPMRTDVDFTSETPRVSFRVQATTVLVQVIPVIVRFRRLLKDK